MVEYKNVSDWLRQWVAMFYRVFYYYNLSGQLIFIGMILNDFELVFKLIIIKT